MKVGHLIRAERVKQDMKQIVLANGICTPSYLSKIERNLIVPSEEVVLLLFEKLGLDLSKLQKSDQKSELEFEKMLKVTYKEVITKRDDNFTKQKIAELEQQSPLFENDSLYYTYLLMLLRFRLIVGGDLEKRKKEIENMDEFSDDFDPMHTYLFKVNKAVYYYSIKNRRQSIIYLEDVLSLINTIPLDSWERAELNYMIGLVYTADNRIFNSIEYIRKALDYFRENFSMGRVLECYVLIGVTQKRSEQFQEAFESYHKAKQLCDEFNLHREKGLVYHNLGSLYSIMGNNEEAINHFTQSIEFKSDEKSKLISILGLILEYSKLKNKELVNEWCNIGLTLLDRLNDNNLKSYVHHFNFLKSLHSDQGLSEEIAEKTIEHFKTLQDYQNIHKYSIALAEWYFKNRKYKLSSILFNEANRYGYIYRKNQKWEDL